MSDYSHLEEMTIDELVELLVLSKGVGNSFEVLKQKPEPDIVDYFNDEKTTVLKRITLYEFMLRCGFDVSCIEDPRGSFKNGFSHTQVNKKGRVRVP